jgi:hypothetical protein
MKHYQCKVRLGSNATVPFPLALIPIRAFAVRTANDLSGAASPRPLCFGCGQGLGFLPSTTISPPDMPSPSFIEPCLPSPADKPPSGTNWIHEIKHDGYRMMARRDPAGSVC